MNAARDRASSRVAVLVPCFDEAITIADVVAEFRAVLPDADIYVFDNGSRDRSATLAREAGARVIHEPRRGKGHVVQAMLRTVDADVYVLVDGDRTYPATAVQSLIEPLLDGRADMVVGSRLHPDAVSEFDIMNRWGNQFFVLLARVLFRISITDLLSGYRAFTPSVARGVCLTSAGFEVDTELTIRANQARLRVVEVPVNLRRRPPGGRSKIRRTRDGMAIIRTMVALWRLGSHRRGPG